MTRWIRIDRHDLILNTNWTLNNIVNVQENNSNNIFHIFFNTIKHIYMRKTLMSAYDTHEIKIMKNKETC